jgi:hypothetical protein
MKKILRLLADSLKALRFYPGSLVCMTGFAVLSLLHFDIIKSDISPLLNACVFGAALTLPVASIVIRKYPGRPALLWIANALCIGIVPLVAYGIKASSAVVFCGTAVALILFLLIRTAETPGAGLGPILFRFLRSLFL